MLNREICNDVSTRHYTVHLNQHRKVLLLSTGSGRG